MILNSQIFSMMICEKPKVLNGNYILSSCSDVWKTKNDLSDYFKLVGDRYQCQLNDSLDCDDILQPLDIAFLNKAKHMNDLLCFRSIASEFIEKIGTYPSSEIYSSILNELVFLGWDVSDPLLISASIHGIYPLYFNENLENLEIVSYDEINQYFLLNDYHIAEKYCEINNKENTEHHPWFPIGIWVDKNTYSILTNM